MFDFDTHPLLQDAPRLKEDVEYWKGSAPRQQSVRMLTEAMQAANYNDPVFDDESYPEYALVALANEAITLAQFTTIMHIWAAKQDYADVVLTEHRFVDAEGESIPETRHRLRHFMNLYARSDLGIFLALSSAEVNTVLMRLRASDVPASEKVFFTFRTHKSTIPKIYHALVENVGFHLFMPLPVGNDIFEFIIPSLTLMQAVLDTIGKHTVELIPMIGATPGTGVLRAHRANQHPLGISFPGFNHTIADGYKSKRKGFIDHDFYHPTLLSYNPMRAAYNHLARLAQTFAEDATAADAPAITSGIVERLIDLEHASYIFLGSQQHSLTASTNVLTDLREFLFINNLAQCFFPVPTEQEQDAFKPETFKFNATQKAFFEFMLQDMFDNADFWQRKFDFPVTKFLAVAMQLTQLYSAEDIPFSVSFSHDGIIKFMRAYATEVETIVGANPHAFVRKHNEQRQAIQRMLEDDNDTELAAALTNPDWDVLTKALIQSTPTCDDNAAAANDTTTDPLVAQLIANGKVKCLNVLLQHKAFDPNMIVGESEDSYRDKRGKHLLHITAENNQTAVMAALLEHGADANVYDLEQKTPLEICLAEGNTEGARLCINARGAGTKWLAYLQENQMIHADCLPLIEKYRDFKRQLADFMDRILAPNSAKKPASTDEFEALSSAFKEFNIPTQYESTCSIDHCRSDASSKPIMRGYRAESLLGEMMGKWEYSHQKQNLAKMMRAIIQHTAPIKQKKLEKHLSHCLKFRTTVDTSLVNLLLELGATVTVDSVKTALTLNHPALLQQLLDAVPDDNKALFQQQAALIFIAFWDMKDAGSDNAQTCLRILVTFGIDLNSPVPLSITSGNFLANFFSGPKTMGLTPWQVLLQNPLEKPSYSPKKLPVALHRLCLELGADPEPVGVPAKLIPRTTADAAGTAANLPMFGHPDRVPGGANAAVANPPILS